MNLTITARSKPLKQPFPLNTPPAPLALPIQKLPQKPTSSPSNCHSLLFLNCLNQAESKEQQLEPIGDLSPNKSNQQTPRSPFNTDKENKRKISLSIPQKGLRQPQPNSEPIKWPFSLPVSPILLKPEAEEKDIKMNSTSASQIRNAKQQLEISKNSFTFLNASPQINSFQLRQDTHKQLRPSDVATLHFDQNADRFRLFPYPPGDKHLNETKDNNPSNHITQNHRQPLLEYPEQAGTKQEGIFKVKERRWIGEYAKTIKTINQSDRQDHSEIESVVIERAHFPNHVPTFAPLNRGSIKDCSVETAALGRGYGSVGEELHKARLNPHFGSINQTIEEDLYDSEV